MKVEELVQGLVGKQCKCLFTGLMVSGRITEVITSETLIEVQVVFDTPCICQGILYEHTWLRVILPEGIEEINFLSLDDED